MKWLIWLALLMLGALALAGTGDGRGSGPARGFLFESVEAQGRVYDYAVYVPRSYDGGREWPLVVFLHGYGECGEDGQHQLAVGLGPRLVWNPERYPAVVLFPQKPVHEDQWERHSEAVGRMMEEAKRAYRIDEERVYLTGLSQGGHGTWALNAEMPGVFAALVPVCGFVDVPWGPRGEREWASPEEAEGFARIAEAARGVAVWAFHGEADDVVPVGQTEGMVEALRERGGDARLTTYPEVGHNAWEAAYGSEELSAWLFEQRLGDGRDGAGRGE